MLLSKFYPFMEAGVYSIEVRLDSSAFDASDSNLAKQATSKVALTVLPRSPQKLQKIAQELGEEAIQANSYVTRLQAISALAYMRDPVAVPYLKRVLQEGQQIRIEAAQGLARIENPEAIDALVAAETTTTDTELRGQLKIILRDLLNKVQESDTRAKIAAALQRS
jgi:HEAT repeat protein